MINVPDLIKTIENYTFQRSWLTDSFFIKKVISVTSMLFTCLGPLILSSFSAYTQINTNIERLPLEGKIIQSTTNCIMQDRNGFLWFGTDDGLNRYDGYTIKNYRTIIGDKTSLSHNEVT